MSSFSARKNGILTNFVSQPVVRESDIAANVCQLNRSMQQLSNQLIHKCLP
jgi:hypothetical protein